MKAFDAYGIWHWLSKDGNLLQDRTWPSKVLNSQVLGLVEGNLGDPTLNSSSIYSQGRYWQLDHMVLSGRGAVFVRILNIKSSTEFWGFHPESHWVASHYWEWPETSKKTRYCTSSRRWCLVDFQLECCNHLTFPWILSNQFMILHRDWKVGLGKTGGWLRMNLGRQG